MFALLRQLRRRPDGTSEYADTEVESDVITIGSAPDRDIQLLGAGVEADHAVIRRSGDSVGISCRGRARITVNGAPQSAATLNRGDVIAVSGNLVTVLDPPGGFDVALAIQPDADVKKSEFESAFRTDLEQTWLSKRRTSWLLLLLTVVLAFAVPLASALLHRQGATTTRWLPDDTFWSAGPLTEAHAQAVGRRCEACHLTFFSHVRDVECRKCHDKILDHIEKDHLALTQLGPTQRCGQCHEEHNARAGSLIERSDTLCVACHAHPDPRFGPLHVDPAAAFVEGQHPLFKVTLPIPTAPRETPGQMANNILPVNWKLERLPLDAARESSNLKYSHAQHLDVNQVQRRTDGKALGCSDCHVLAADGEHFAPITMATACSSCHPLTFDDRAPDRQLPHGKPRDAMLLIQDYYAHRFSDPSLAGPTVVRRRLPDDPTVQDKCTDSALSCANKRAALEITNQFTRQGCISCHVVSDNKAPDVLDRFAVLPIRLVRDYFPKVHFNHKVHAVQKDLTGDAACQSCHKARDSTDNRVLMLPNLGKCLECHGESFAKDKIATPCTGCHAYHPQP